MRIELKSQSEKMSEVAITLAPDERSALAEKLKKLEMQDELKIYDSGITIFFKLRTADTRLLIAHPEENEWVMTVGMEPRLRDMFCQKLLSDQSFTTQDIGLESRVNNARLWVQ